MIRVRVRVRARVRRRTPAVLSDDVTRMMRRVMVRPAEIPNSALSVVVAVIVPNSIDSRYFVVPICSYM